MSMVSNLSAPNEQAAGDLTGSAVASRQSMPKTSTTKLKRSILPRQGIVGQYLHAAKASEPAI
ncbi:hypothetical protein N7481_010229 [Penicillium waksmanii]|uniref:uncharacterized protein n=1 Tax=Penicillium waksmanii TaxID=69791 RepID=UPI00254795D2|nr:uncharacterized protein N7481_010229 [Penicillium waksmanii]KAJ5976522.1 hypothetical protein N7481_010229 [Penicillium waksmanii]